MFQFLSYILVVSPADPQRWTKDHRRYQARPPQPAASRLHVVHLPTTESPFRRQATSVRDSRGIPGSGKLTELSTPCPAQRIRQLPPSRTSHTQRPHHHHLPASIMTITPLAYNLMMWCGNCVRRRGPKRHEGVYYFYPCFSTAFLSSSRGRRRAVLSG